MRLVRFHGFYAEVQGIGDLTGPMTFPDESEHFQFTVGQFRDGRVLCRIRAADIMLQHAIGDPVAHINFATEDAA